MPTPKKHTDAAAKHRAYRLRQAAARQAEREAKGLPPAPSVPGTPHWQALIEVARAALDTAVEMQSYFGERGESFRERLEAIEQLVSEIENLPGP